MLRSSGPSPDKREQKFSPESKSDGHVTTSFVFVFLIDVWSSEVIECGVWNEIIDGQQRVLKAGDHMKNIFEREEVRMTEFSYKVHCSSTYDSEMLSHQDDTESLLSGASFRSQTREYDA